MKHKNILYALLAIFSINLGKSANNEKGSWVDLKNARSAYINSDVRSELVGFKVYPLDVISELSNITQVIRITVTGEWGKSRSLMIYRNDNGHAVEKAQRIIDPHGLSIVSCSINKEKFEEIRRAFDQVQQKIDSENDSIDPSKIEQESITPLVLLEKISSNGAYAGALLSPSSLGLASRLLDDTISMIDIACPSK